MLFYWVSLSVLGGLIGSFLKFDTSGIDFALTALFIVILINQMKNAENGRLPALIAAVSSAVCLVIFGADGFILPSLVITVALLFLLRSVIEKEKREAGA